MDLVNFLKQIIPTDLGGVMAAASVVGGIIFFILETLDKLMTLTWLTKRVLSVALAIIIPGGAALLLVLLGTNPATFNLAFLAVVVIGYTVSQVAHGALEKKVTPKIG